jgi:mono/diheme cytochrome c family protein
VEANQGWSKDEVEFFYHASEGTLLAPLDFVLQLPHPKETDAKFVDRLEKYGFIKGASGPLNPHQLPVGLAEDRRPIRFGDRSYLGLTCAACHTRELTYRKTNGDGEGTNYRISVYAGPSLIDLPRFIQDLYDGFEAIIEDDDLAQKFAEDLGDKEVSAEDVKALRAEIAEFIAPVRLWRGMIKKAKLPAVDFGPGNLNALSQGNLHEAGLAAWLKGQGVELPNLTPTPPPRFEGTVNYPPLWFGAQDDWAQWFVKIHHTGARNWIQAVASSAVRPPKMVKSLGVKAVVATVDFENIARIQASLERLRTPKWPAHVFGELDSGRVAKGRKLYEKSCAECHARKLLPPNELGIALYERQAFDVGTDATAYQQFAEYGEARAAGLVFLSEKLIAFRRVQLLDRVDEKQADNYAKMDSRGRPNLWALAIDENSGRPGGDYWPTSGATYWAPPLEGVFATSPYFHNGSVRTLWEVLTRPEKRTKAFHTGTTAFDAKEVGLCDDGEFIYDARDLGKGNGGHPFGCEWSDEEKLNLLEFLKSL